jgi:molybdenum cofactor synthesis domain-containing protein
MRAAILTCSDKGAAGERTDTSGYAIEALLREAGVEVVARAVVADDRWRIAEQLKDWADSETADLIVTTGGTGLTPRDVTPEATLDAIEREVPGLAEAFRAEGLKKTPYAALSRGVCGTRGKTLIVNTPGSEKAVREYLSVLVPLLPHISELLAGPTEH